MVALLFLDRVEVTVALQHGQTLVSLLMTLALRMLSRRSLLPHPTVH